MILGQTIRAPVGATATYYSPWFPRQGTRAVFACNLIDAYEVPATSGFRITVQTKKSEDDTTSTNVVEVNGGAEDITISPDTVTRIVRGNAMDASATDQGFLDLVRFKYELAGNATKRAWVHFRMLEPTWVTD